MNDIRILVRDLTAAAYETGYYTGKGDIGTMQYLAAVTKARESGEAIITIIERYERSHEEEKDTDRVVKCARCGNVTSSNYTMVASVGNQIVGPLCPSCHTDYCVDYERGL